MKYSCLNQLKKFIFPGKCHYSRMSFNLHNFSFFVEENFWSSFITTLCHDILYTFVTHFMASFLWDISRKRERKSEKKIKLCNVKHVALGEKKKKLLAHAKCIRKKWNHLGMIDGAINYKLGHTIIIIHIEN